MIEIDKFLWCYSNEHDKYWGWIRFDNTFYNFWGKRGNKKITFKRYMCMNGYDMPSKLKLLFREKLDKKGYKDFTGHDKIERFFPNFHREFEIQLTIAKLGDNFHNERD
jgi:hypothetical protein